MDRPKDWIARHPGRRRNYEARVAEAGPRRQANSCLSRSASRGGRQRNCADVAAALDAWACSAPRLSVLALQLEAGSIPSFEFRQRLRGALPRAYQWADGSSYVNHVELVRKARGAALPPSFWTEPLLTGGSDSFLGPRDAIPMLDEAYDLDLEAEVAV